MIAGNLDFSTCVASAFLLAFIKKFCTLGVVFESSMPELFRGCESSKVWNVAGFQGSRIWNLRDVASSLESVDFGSSKYNAKLTHALISTHRIQDLNLMCLQKRLGLEAS